MSDIGKCRSKGDSTRMKSVDRFKANDLDRKFSMQKWLKEQREQEPTLSWIDVNECLGVQE